MPGSRKGERRGGAKPSVLRVKKADKPAGSSAPKKPRAPQEQNGGRRYGSHSKPSFDPHVGVLLTKNRSPLKREQELEMYFLITGKRMRMPKEVMLDAMGYFEDRAVQHVQVAYANLEMAEQADTPEQRRVYNEAAMLEEARAREYLVTATDVAYKVAPFVHPRLSAIMTNPGANDSPMTLLATLMRELDEAGQPPRYIDHQANEGQSND